MIKNEDYKEIEVLVNIFISCWIPHECSRLILNSYNWNIVKWESYIFSMKEACK